jgi:hypothetical protein
MYVSFGGVRVEQRVGQFGFYMTAPYQINLTEDGDIERK